jgi:hypothetical protein
LKQFEYFGNQNLIKEEIKRRLYSGNAYFQSVQNLFTSCLLSKNINIRIYKPIIFPLVLYGCRTWIFENRVLRRIFGPKRDEVAEGCRKLHNEELHNLYPSPSTIRMMKSRRMRRARHVAGVKRRGMHAGFWWERQKEGDH